MSRKPTRRCQGCGESVPTGDLNFKRVSNNRRVRYCDQCEALRQLYDIRREDHEQYRLQETADELAAESSGDTE
jgi:NAD-dependent SIR2 family protein deacetylase